MPSTRSAIAEGFEPTYKELKLVAILPIFMFGITKERTEAFYFSADALKKLKKEISDKGGFPCSTHVALSAYLSKMLLKLFNHSEKTTCVQVTVANLRNRLAEIPSTFVGNASSIFATPNFSAGASLEEIAGIIHQTLQPLLETSLEELRKIEEKSWGQVLILEFENSHGRTQRFAPTFIIYQIFIVS
ncbi:MAG: hypothetical protein GX428_03215 [Candidatus Atribacteria bacterium]|nr:hypothetical protein [Candidatus Atribacteria bacterium]